MNHSGNRDRSHQGRPSDASGPRPPPVVCSFCSRHGHTIDKCYTKERADRAASSQPAAPSAYMADTKAPEEPKTIVYHHAFLAATSTPFASIPVEDRAPVVTPAAAPTAPAVKPNLLFIVYDTGATAHMWGSKSDMQSYTAVEMSAGCCTMCVQQ